MFENPFSFEGRIRRTEYGISIIIGTICLVIIGAISEASDGAAFIIFAYIPLFWFLWAQGAKRCHDVGNSGWWQLIPLYGFWLLFEDGEYAINQYGINPKSTASQQKLKTNRNQNNYGNQQSGYQGNYSGGHNNYGNNNPEMSGKQVQDTEYREGDLYK